MKSSAGRFFEDYRLGELIVHPTPRTVSGGERALYHALYPARHALNSSNEFARGCGLAEAPLDDLLTFHLCFGRSVPDISLNAIANLGYADLRWLQPVYEGDTLRAESTVIGLKQTSNGQSGVVWVRTRAVNRDEEPVMEWVRWAMLRKRDPAAPAPDSVVPQLAAEVIPERLSVPKRLTFTHYDFRLAGEPWRLGDYAVGERIDHRDAVTVEEAEHMLATRLYQNTARVHFDVRAREDGRRLVYGGHVISLARALSFNGLANAQLMVAVNAGTHANPCFAGDTVAAWSEVLDRAETAAPGVGAIRLRTVAYRAGAATPFPGRDAAGKYPPEVLLDLDYWALMPV
jgi:2-methylfumaryl-CoA hydratase